MIEKQIYNVINENLMINERKVQEKLNSKKFS